MKIPATGATQSSTYETLSAAKAIDGNMATLSHTLCSNNPDTQLWLKIQYGGCRVISHVVLYPSHYDQDNVHRLKDAQVRVLKGGQEQYPCGRVVPEVGKVRYASSSLLPNLTPPLPHPQVRYDMPCYPGPGQCGDEVMVATQYREQWVHVCIHLLEVEAYVTIGLGKV